MLSIKAEKGSAGLEFTLLFPFLLFVTFGIIEFGALMFNKAILTNAAREGVRAAITYTFEGAGTPTCTDEFTNIINISRTAVRRYLQNIDQTYWFPINDPDERPLEADEITVSINNVTRDTLNVQVVYDYHFIFINSIVNALSSGTAGATLQLMAEAEMRGEDNYRLPDDTTLPLVEYLGPDYLNCS